jgi:hypothetical protein
MAKAKTKAKPKKKEEPALPKIYELMDAVREEDGKESKAGLRRQRVALSEISKLCKVARVQILEQMKSL